MTDLTIQDIDDLAKTVSICWPSQRGAELQDKLAVLRKQIQDDACDEIASLPHGGAGAARAKRMPVRKSAEGRLRALEVTVTRGDEESPGMKAAMENNHNTLEDTATAAVNAKLAKIDGVEIDQDFGAVPVKPRYLLKVEGFAGRPSLPVHRGYRILQPVDPVRLSTKRRATLKKPADQPMPEFEPPTPEHVKVEKSTDTDTDTDADADVDGPYSHAELSRIALERSGVK